MPYPTLESLPDGVKVLPKDAQEIWRNAANSALEKYPGDDERAAKIGWGAVKNAGWAKDAEGNWKKAHAETHELLAEIFSVGIWNGDAYTEGDLNEIVHAFYELKDKIKPPVKLAHDNKAHLQDGQPALGWVKHLKKVGDKLIATLSDVPDIVYKAIQANRYKRISAEIYWNLKEGGRTFRRVLAAVGLLGTDIPAVTNLADLEAYLSLTPDAGTFEKMASYSFDVDENGEIKTEDEEDLDMDNKEEIKKLTDELNEAKAKLKETEGENKTYKAEAEALKKEKSEGLKKARTDEVKTFCEQMVKDGKMTPAARDILVKDLEKHIYSDEKGFSITFEDFKKCFETHAKVFDVTEKGKDDDLGDKGDYKNAGEELDVKTKKYMVDHKEVNYLDASQAVLNADKDLAKRYANED